MYEEDELLPVSALQHMVFCERRAALVCLEGLWKDNVYTAEGSILHEQTDVAETECRGELRIARGLWLRSLELGLTGRADVIEFKYEEHATLGTSVELSGSEGFWQPFPVEYKRGQLRAEESFEVQLCGQALCLEEMLRINVPAGALYYGKTRRRLEIPFTAEIRNKTRNTALRLHELVSGGVTPLAKSEVKCRSCSLFDICLPAAMDKGRDVSNYLRQATVIVESSP
jgi:CRISPR-associated exonuclease Cas4